MWLALRNVRQDEKIRWFRNRTERTNKEAEQEDYWCYVLNVVEITNNLLIWTLNVE